MKICRRLAAVLAVSAISLFAYGCGGGGGGGGSGASSSSSSSSSSSEVAFTAGTEIRVTDHDSGFAYGPVLAGLSNGHYVAVWQDIGAPDTEGYGVFFRIYDAAGNAQGAVQLTNTSMDDHQWYPSVSSLNGGFVIVWRDDGNPAGKVVRLQRFDNAGVRQGDEIQVNSDPIYDLWNPQVIGLHSGGYVVTWNDFYPNMGGSVPPRNNFMAQAFDASGNKVGSEKLLYAHGDGTGPAYDFAPLSGGGFVVVHDRLAARSGSTHDHNIIVQLFTDAAETTGTAFYGNGTAFNGVYSVVEGLKDGGFVIVFSSDTVESGLLKRLRLQRFNASGDRLGSESFVNETGISQENVPSITGLGHGGFVVAWENTAGMQAQVFTATGARARQPYIIQGQHNYPYIASASDKSFAAIWLDNTVMASVRLKLYTKP